MDLTISQDQEDVIDIKLETLSHVLDDLLDDWTEISGSMEVNEL